MHRRALGLLLAAVVLPTAGFAQDATDMDQPPATETAPPADTSPAPAPAAPVATITPPAAPAATVTTPPTDEASPPQRTTITTRATATRTVTRAPVSRPVRAPAPSPLVETVPIADTAPLPPPVASPPPAAVAPEILPVETAQPAAEQRDDRASFLPWLLIGAVLLGGALWLLSRRRRSAAGAYDAVYERRSETVRPETVAADPVLAAPVMAAEVPVEAAPVAAIAEEPAGRPWLDLKLRPVRAGVREEDARVEFELTVDNHGSAAARDVRISTWMLAAGSPQETEMERMLIEPPAEARLPEVTIGAGEAKRVEATVVLPRESLGDSILPVVFADARYRLPDGSEGRTSASFAVGVPDGDDMAYFDVEHPSGLHEGVEARLRGEAEQV